MQSADSPPANRPVLSPAKCRFEELSDGELVLVTPAGQRHERVGIVRAFPLSAPDGPLAVLDATGRELLWAAAVEDFPDGSRQRVTERLAAGEFRPRIDAILSASRQEPVTWEVLTDRGRHTFELATDGIERHTDGAASVTDTAGIRYQIPAVQHLDRRSRQLLDRAN